MDFVHVTGFTAVRDYLFPLVVERLAFQQFANRVEPYMRFDYENV